MPWIICKHTPIAREMLVQVIGARALLFENIYFKSMQFFLLLRDLRLAAFREHTAYKSFCFICVVLIYHFYSALSNQHLKTGVSNRILEFWLPWRIGWLVLLGQPSLWCSCSWVGSAALVGAVGYCLLLSPSFCLVT